MGRRGEMWESNGLESSRAGGFLPKNDLPLVGISGKIRNDLRAMVPQNE